MMGKEVPAQGQTMAGWGTVPDTDERKGAWKRGFVWKGGGRLGESQGNCSPPARTQQGQRAGGQGTASLDDKVLRTTAPKGAQPQTQIL